MGSWSFNLWKAAIIVFCLVAFGLTVFGGDMLASIKSSVGGSVSELFQENVTWSFRYNDEEGSRFSVLRDVEIHGQLLKLETVDEPEEIQQGLSDRRSMQDDEGLLFVMPNVDIHTFWMYHMNFAIDMIWLRDGVVVEIAPNMPPPSETKGIPMTHTPKVDSDMVLELTASGAERYGIKVGDKLDF